MNKPLVSICCITYNHGPYIRDCLDGFMMQKTDFPFEVLIHDDASTDNTADIIREYEAKYPDIIKPICQTENQHSKGVRISIVYNYSRAQGKYIALCEGDDYWTDPGKLQMQISYMESHPQCTICTHRVENIWADRRPMHSFVPARILETRQFHVKDVLSKPLNYFQTSSYVFRRELLSKELPDYFTKACYGDIATLIYMTDCGYGYYMHRQMSCWRHQVKSSINKLAERKRSLFYRTAQKQNAFWNMVKTAFEGRGDFEVCDFFIGESELEMSCSAEAFKQRRHAYFANFSRFSWQKRVFYAILVFVPEGILQQWIMTFYQQLKYFLTSTLLKPKTKKS